MNTLCVFSGQGYKNNALLSFFQENTAAQTLLKNYSTAMSIQPSWSLNDPNVSQLLIGAYQLTLFNVIKPLLENHQVTLAGYSLGEVNAFLASIDATPEEANAVLSGRTQLMTSILKQSNEYDLLFIRGSFLLENVQQLCADHDCAIAIINSEERFIIGGAVNDLHALLIQLQKYPLTHSQFLNIHLPSHTFYYEPQKTLFQKQLNALTSRPLLYPILSPLELCKIDDAEQEKQLLDKELYTILQWHKLCKLIPEYQYDIILDLGPGDAMTQQLITITPELPILTLANYTNCSGLLNAIKNRTTQ